MKQEILDALLHLQQTINSVIDKSTETGKDIINIDLISMEAQISDYIDDIKYIDEIEFDEEDEIDLFEMDDEDYMPNDNNDDY